MINFPNCYGNAVTCINNLPECRILNELCVFIYIIPCILAACPKYPLGSLKPREHGPHFYPQQSPRCVENERLDGENESWKGEGRWKRALKKTFQPGTSGFLQTCCGFSWRFGKTLTKTGITMDPALLCAADLKGQEQQESWAECLIRGGEPGSKRSG